MNDKILLIYNADWFSRTQGLESVPIITKIHSSPEKQITYNTQIR